MLLPPETAKNWAVWLFQGYPLGLAASTGISTQLPYQKPPFQPIWTQLPTTEKLRRKAGNMIAVLADVFHRGCFLGHPNWLKWRLLVGKLCGNPCRICLSLLFLVAIAWCLRMGKRVSKMDFEIFEDSRFLIPLQDCSLTSYVPGLHNFYIRDFST